MSGWGVALVGITCMLGGVIIGFGLCAILSMAKQSDERAEESMHHIDKLV